MTFSDTEAAELLAMEAPDYDEFYLEMGRCLAAWSDVELRLFRIFENCINTDPLRRAIIFDKSPTIETKISMLDEIIKAVPAFIKLPGKHDHAIIKKWDKVRIKIGEIKHVRNAICHNPIFFIIKRSEKKIYIEITPTPMSNMRKRMQSRYRIKELKHISRM